MLFTETQIMIVVLCKIGLDVILLLRHAGKIHKLQNQQVDHLHKMTWLLEQIKDK